MTQDIDGIVSGIEKILNDRSLLIDAGDYNKKYNYQIEATDYFLTKTLSALKSQADLIAQRDAEIELLRTALTPFVEQYKHCNECEIKKANGRFSKRILRARFALAEKGDIIAQRDAEIERLKSHITEWAKAEHKYKSLEPFKFPYSEEASDAIYMKVFWNKALNDIAEQPTTPETKDT